MRNNLYKVKLKDILSVKRGTSLSGQYYATEGNKIRLTLGNFNYPNGGFKTNTSKDNIYFSAPVKREYILKKGDIITPLTEQVAGLLGETAKIPEDDLYIQSGDIALIIPKEDKLDKGFAYYLISSKMIKYQLGAAAQQTKIRHTSPEKIENCEAWIPSDLNSQKNIAYFLDMLNDKITLNNKINQELEQMAKTLYEYWFVQFDFPDEKGRPYKSANGKMVYNEVLKREIPEGWEVSLYDIATYINGLACQKFRPTDRNSYNVIKIKELHTGFNEETEKVRKNIPTKYIVNDGDILFSWSATLEVHMWTGGQGVLNQHIFNVRSKEYPKSFCYYILNEYVKVFKKIAETRKTTMGHITIDHLKQAYVLVPPLDLINALDNKIKPIFDSIITHRKEQQSLANIRDFLLPLLMNGQVTVSPEC